MKRRLFTGLMLVMLAGFMILPACGGGGGGGGGGTGFLTGTWAGTLVAPTGNWNMVMVVNQDGLNVNGTITATKGAQTLTGSFTGTVSNATADGTVTFAWVDNLGETLTYVGTYNAIHMNGTWTSTTTATGTWTVDKV